MSQVVQEEEEAAPTSYAVGPPGSALSAPDKNSSKPSNDINNSSSSGGDAVAAEGGNVLERIVGTLGLVEIWVFAAYAFGNFASFTTYEDILFDTMVAFEVLGLLTVVLSSLYMCSDAPQGAHRSGNMATLSRDAFHNLVYPRSAPGSRERHGYAGTAWFGVLLSVVPVPLLLSFYPVWESVFDDPLYARLVPCILAVLAMVGSVAGGMFIEANQSSYVLAVMYATSKAISLFVLFADAERLLLGEGGAAGSAAIGLVLACFQVVKMASASLAALKYLRGMPDEDMPKLDGVWIFCTAVVGCVF